jgi:hypothetical protein
MALVKKALLSAEQQALVKAAHLSNQKGCF